MFRRPTKLLNKAGARTTAALRASDVSHGHTDESRIVGFDAPASNRPLTTVAPSDQDWSELLWLGLVMLAIACAATEQVMQ